MNVALRPDHGSLDYISLCTGGGGLDLGVELAIPCARAVCMVEREAAAVATLVAAMEVGHLASAPVWSDARTLDGRAWRGLVDGVIGGIPCQPHSVAGKRLGRDDPRDLWGAARRILVQSGAWWVLIENVPGMLTSGGAERVWRDLGRLGFEREIGLFSAAEVGASHERQRLFILGVADRYHSDDDGALDEWWSRRLEFTDGGRGMADADGAGSSLGPVLARDGGEECPASVGIRRDDLVDTARLGRREGRSGAELRGGRNAARGADGAMGDADGQGQPQSRRRLAEGWGRSCDAGDAIDRTALGLTPPGPGDRDGWSRIIAARPDLAPAVEPAVRRVADGVAGGLDLPLVVDRWRIDALRMLGNGVHPLVGAHAFRTLATRLAGRCAGAARLVRMMGVDR